MSSFNLSKTAPAGTSDLPTELTMVVCKADPWFQGASSPEERTDMLGLALNPVNSFSDETSTGVTFVTHIIGKTTENVFKRMIRSSWPQDNGSAGDRGVKRGKQGLCRAVQWTLSDTMIFCSCGTFWAMFH